MTKVARPSFVFRADAELVRDAPVTVFPVHVQPLIAEWKRQLEEAAEQAPSDALTDFAHCDERRDR